MRNRHGIEVNPICAACKHRVLNNDGRFCGIDNTPVASNHSCDSWEMSEGLKEAGRSGGKIKKWHYLCFFRERWIEQQGKLMTGEIDASQFLSAEDIRKQYNEQHGSEFNNF